MSVLLDRIMEGSMVLLIIGISLAFARAVRGPQIHRPYRLPSI